MHPDQVAAIHVYAYMQIESVLHKLQLCHFVTSFCRHTQLSPYPVCQDLLYSPATGAQPRDGLSHWPYG